MKNYSDYLLIIGVIVAGIGAILCLIGVILRITHETLRNINL